MPPSSRPCSRTCRCRDHASGSCQTGWTSSDGDRLVSRDAGLTHRITHQIGKNEVLLLSVGRLEANKGFTDLADALAGLQSPTAMAMGRGRRRPDARGARAPDRRTGAERAHHSCRSNRRCGTARVVRGGRPVRAPDPIRGQLARHAGGDAARTACGGDTCRRPARQGDPRPDRMAGAALGSRGARRGALGGHRRAHALARHGPRRARTARAALRLACDSGDVSNCTNCSRFVLDRLRTNWIS